MALQTQTYKSATSSKSFTLELTLTENSVSDTANTSSITYKLVLKSGGWYFSDYSHGHKVSLGGKVVSEVTHTAYQNQVSLGANSSLTVASGTTTIEHDTNGDKSLSVSFSFYTSYTGTLSGSGTMALTHINRGLVYIDNGSKLVAAQVYIDNGSEWKLAIPYIDNGTTWKLCT